MGSLFEALMRFILAALIALALVAPSEAARRRGPSCQHTPGMLCYPNPDPGAGLGTFICAPRPAPKAPAP
jgi:hypothetical protein